MKKAILIQARLSSSRFPGKMLSYIKGEHLIDFVFKRCSESTRADSVAVITSGDKSDNALYEHCLSQGFPVFRGSLDNVLDRYITAAKFFNADFICRVCGDSPFVDYNLIDKMFVILERDNFDFVSLSPRDCIPGFISEVVTLKALEKAYVNHRSEQELEHVTLFIRENPNIFKINYLSSGLVTRSRLNLKLTVDYPEDLYICNKIADFLGNNFSSEDVLRVLDNEIEIFNNYGYQDSSVS